MIIFQNILYSDTYEFRKIILEWEEQNYSFNYIYLWEQ